MYIYIYTHTDIHSQNSLENGRKIKTSWES